MYAKKSISETLTAHRGNTCELCGTSAKPWPRTGKRRYPHKCQHGEWCVRGHRLLGWHQNHATCAKCLALEKKP